MNLLKRPLMFAGLLLLPLTAQELSLDDIVAKHIAAMGGAGKIKALTSARITGKVIIGGGQMEAPVTVWTQRPKKNRTEINFQGQKIVQAFDGTTAWMINPMAGGSDPQKMPDDEAKMAADDADPDGSPLINYKEKGNTIELLGKEDVEGAMAYKLKVTLKSNNVSTQYLDEKTFLPSKIVGKRKQMGQEFEAESFPGNYKAVDGVMIPFAVETRIGGRSMMQMQIEKVEPNVKIDSALFEMPAPEKPKETKNPAKQ